MPRNRSEKVQSCPQAIAYAELIESGERTYAATSRAWDAIPFGPGNYIHKERNRLIREEDLEGREASLLANARIIRENYGA